MYAFLHILPRKAAPETMAKESNPMSWPSHLRWGVTHPLSAYVILVPSSPAILLVVTTTGSVQKNNRFARTLIGLRERKIEQQTEIDISSTINPATNRTYFRGLTTVRRFQTFSKPQKVKISNRYDLLYNREFSHTASLEARSFHGPAQVAILYFTL
jgi:hypothetical protein